jgi:hypothetical protein
MSRAFIRFAGAVTMVVGSILALCTPAIAHEERHVGHYHFAVGFGDEPAYAGQKNSVQLILTGATGKPVVNLGSTLKVEVGYGPQRMNPLPMEPNFEIGESGLPGDYRGWFFPTRPGQYSFHFTGSIHGTSVDETFRSGPTTFSDVEDAQSVQFPAKDPTTGQLNELLGRQTQRLNQGIASTRSQASSDVASARNLAFVGLGLGVIALAVALFGLVNKR